MTTTEDALAGVTQADRKTACKFYGYDDEADLVYWGNVSKHRDVERLAEAFARHRLSAQPVVQGGWQVVPVEPTEAMYRAWFESDTEVRGQGRVRAQFFAEWSAMLAAAPKRDALAGGEEVADIYSDTGRNAGMDEGATFVLENLANQLGVTDWVQADGSEEWEGDVCGTIHNILVAAKVVDDYDGTIARHATPAAPADGGWSAGVEAAHEAIRKRRKEWFCSGPDCTEYDHGRDEGFDLALLALRALTPSARPSEGEVERVARAAVDQNDAMRQELAHLGNLVSDLERAMRVDPANDDGTWPDLAGRINKLKDAALSRAGEVKEG